MEIEEEAIADAINQMENTLSDLVSSFLHRIAPSAKVFPYNDLVRWVIESIDITDRAFYKTNGRMFGTFKPEDVKKMSTLR